MTEVYLFSYLLTGTYSVIVVVGLIFTQGRPQGLKLWTHNRSGAERAWGRWYVILITTLS